VWVSFKETTHGQLAGVAAAMTHDMLVLLYREEKQWRLNFAAQLYTTHQQLREKLLIFYETAVQAAAGRSHDKPVKKTAEDFMKAVSSSKTEGLAGTHFKDGAVELLVVPHCILKAAAAAQGETRQSKRIRIAPRPYPT